MEAFPLRRFCVKLSKLKTRGASGFTAAAALGAYRNPTMDAASVFCFSQSKCGAKLWSNAACRCGTVRADDDDGAAAAAIAFV